jgi:purine-nucleoside phosphorylase
VLLKQLKEIKRTDKKESFDMESAVLFRVAKDFDKHAAAVLQTVNKKDSKQGPYEGKNKEKAMSQELMFTKYILASLAQVA